MPKTHTADPGELQWPIGVQPVALPALADVLDGVSGAETLFGALCDELPRALARGCAADWARAGHAIVDLLAGSVEHRIGGGADA